MGTRIDQLDPGAASEDHKLPAMLNGATIFLTVRQILSFVQGKVAGYLPGYFHAATAKPTLADSDEFAVADSADGFSLKKLTVSNLISTIFVGRQIGNAWFTATTFRLKNGGGFSPIFSIAGLTADRTWNVPNSDISFPFTKEFISAQQTITTAGLLTLAHGLGVAPKVIMPVLVCTTAESGYSVGNTIPCPYTAVSTSANDNFGASIDFSDPTNILVRYGSAGAGVFLYTHKTTGALVGLTNANWRLVMRAWA